MNLENEDGHEPFLTWPEINVFPIHGNDTEARMLRNFEFAMTYILLPTISVFGVVGNVMSMLVLLKHGLHKCSNILIFALALADTLYLVGTNNIALQIYTSGPSFGFFYPERVAEFLFVMYHFEIAMESVGKVVSLILPSCITFERLLAVFFPLHFSRILTPRRIWVTVGALYLFGVSAYVQYQLRFRLVYEVDPSTNRSVGLIADSEIISKHAQYYVIFRQTYIFIYGPFPVGFSLVGCLLIGFKIRFYEKKRKNLMNVKNTFEKDVICEVRKNKLSSLFARFKKYILGRNQESDDSTEKPAHGIKRKSHNSIEVSDSTIEYKSQSGEVCFPSEYASHSPEKLLSSDKTPRHPPDNLPAAALSIRNSSDADEMPLRKITAKHCCPSHRERKSFEGTSAAQSRGVKSASGSGMKRTTRTLLTVCVVYTVIGLFNFVALVYVKYCDVVQVNTSMVVELLRKFGLGVNSSCNFIIYVGLNRNFRDTYREIFCRCARR